MNDNEEFSTKKVRKPYSKSTQTLPSKRDGSELLSLAPDVAYKTVFTHAGRLLSIKDWCLMGMEKRLFERFKMHPQSLEFSRKAASKMKEIGALDDIRFARSYIRGRLSKKSLQTVMRETLAEGVSQEDLAIAIDQLREEGLISEPAEQAWNVWFKKFKTYPLDDNARAKQARFMASRGFSFEIISKIWAKARADGL